MTKEKLIEIITPYGMSGHERIIGLFDSLEHIRKNNIEGDLVECGVWKGANILGIMEYLEYYKMYDRKIWLYDTFAGMTPPEYIDVDCSNVSGFTIMDKFAQDLVIPIKDVKEILSQSKFPIENLIYVIGAVEETLDIKENIPEKISLLRLDTDWYKSTRKELEILYPQVVKNGVLIVDDYGHWQGSKIAVDDYFFQQNITPEIEYLDYTGIKIIKAI